MLSRIIKASCAAVLVTVFVTGSVSAQTTFTSAGVVPANGLLSSMGYKNNRAYTANTNKNRIDVMDLSKPLAPLL
jgi:hypothetical protein